jgi:hypothetical protein
MAPTYGLATVDVPTPEMFKADQLITIENSTAEWHSTVGTAGLESRQISIRLESQANRMPPACGGFHDLARSGQCRASRESQHCKLL